MHPDGFGPWRLYKVRGGQNRSDQPHDIGSKWDSYVNQAKIMLENGQLDFHVQWLVEMAGAGQGEGEDDGYPHPWPCKVRHIYPYLCYENHGEFMSPTYLA